MAAAARKLRSLRLFSAGSSELSDLRRREALTAGQVVEQAAAKAAEPVWSFGTAYANLLHARPLAANAGTSGVLCAVGDALAQLVEWRVGAGRQRSQQNQPPPSFVAAFDAQTGGPIAEQNQPPPSFVAAFDAQRMGRMAAYGTFVCGPLLSVWYRGLNHIGELLSVSYAPVVSWLPGWYKELPGASPARLLATKVVADSLLFQAPFLTLYFGVMGALEGLAPAKIYEKTTQSFHQAWALSLLVWTPVQCVNLFYVPAAFQPAVVSAVNVGWKATLSLLNRSASRDDQRDASSEMALAVLRAENEGLRAELAVLWAENESLRVQREVAEQTGLRRWLSKR